MIRKNNNLQKTIIKETNFNKSEAFFNEEFTYSKCSYRDKYTSSNENSYYSKMMQGKCDNTEIDICFERYGKCLSKNIKIYENML